ncbi:MAG: D-aminoacylase [Chloroflexi bacterium]|nr:D-aminoacylase [Chloroflexota bacterium]
MKQRVAIPGAGQAGRKGLIFDIVISKGRIIDGSGNPWYYGDVGVCGDKIEAIGDLSAASAARVIDARGKIVCPGFMDMHALSDIMLLAEPEHEGKIRQGITAELLGNDGLSYAPVSPPLLQQLRRYLSGLYGNPDIDWNWTSARDFLSRFDGRVSVNVAYLIPQCVLRLGAMGWQRRSPSQREISAMQALIEQGMEDGAVGFSTGLSYPPNSYAGTDELIQLCRAVAKHNGFYVTHMRNYFDHIFEALEEAIRIGRAAQVPVMISHLKIGSARHRGKAGEILALIDRARREGIDVTMNCYPYQAGSGPLFRLLPDWSAEGGPEAMAARLSQPTTRRRIAAYFSEADFDWRACAIAAVRSEANKQLEGQTFDRAIRDSAKDPVDFICDLLLQEDLEVSIINFVGDDVDTAEDIKAVMTHPATMVCTDGLLIGRSPHPRTFGAFARYLRLYAREQRALSWEEAIRKISSLPAQQLRLQTRGLLKRGFSADIVVLDPARVSDCSTFEDGRQYAAGIDQVIVNARLPHDDGRHTGARAGRALRG